jgi:hypothetical protein
VAPLVVGHCSKPTNLSQDPFERINWPAHGFAEGSIAYSDVFKHEMWRFQIPAKVIAEYAPSLVEYPPMHAGASFNIGDLKERIEQAIAAARGMHSNGTVGVALPVASQRRAAYPLKVTKCRRSPARVTKLNETGAIQLANQTSNNWRTL